MADSEKILPKSSRKASGKVTIGHRRRIRTFSQPFVSVYPTRSTKTETIGSNPITQLSIYSKSRLRLMKAEVSDEEMNEDENEFSYAKRQCRTFYQRCILGKTISFVLYIQEICKKMHHNDVDELEKLYQPRTLNSYEYLKDFRDTLEALPDREWRKAVYNVLFPTSENAVCTCEHIQRLIQLLDQLKKTIGLNEDTYKPTNPIDPLKSSQIDGRSMVGLIAYTFTFMVGEMENMNPKIHGPLIRNMQRSFLALAEESIVLWTAICHVSATSDIILSDLNYVIGKYLFHVRPIDAKVVDLSAREDFWGQSRVRYLLRKAKRSRDNHTMELKVSWPSKIRKPSRSKLHIVTRIEDLNTQWHTFSTVFKIEDQFRIAINMIKRARNIITDAFEILNDYDAVLHTHRPNRKEPETATLFEDSIYLKDRGVDLNRFPTSALYSDEVESVYEVGRILSDKVDELYIAIYSTKDLVRETCHVVQLCYEYLKANEKWIYEPWDTLATDIQEGYEFTWSHYKTFNPQEPLYPIRNPVALFNGSFYPTLLRMVPIKVAKLYISFQTTDEIAARKDPSSHSLWDAFDTIPNTPYKLEADEKHLKS